MAHREVRAVAVGRDRTAVLLPATLAGPVDLDGGIVRQSARVAQGPLQEQLADQAAGPVRIRRHDVQPGTLRDGEGLGQAHVSRAEVRPPQVHH